MARGSWVTAIALVSQGDPLSVPVLAVRGAAGALASRSKGFQVILRCIGIVSSPGLSQRLHSIQSIIRSP